MDFLEELTLLSQKHRKFIHGCGCCGSPFIVDFDEENVVKLFNVDGDITKNKYTLTPTLEQLVFEKEKTNE